MIFTVKPIQPEKLENLQWKITYKIKLTIKHWLLYMKLRNGHEVTKTLLRFHYCLCWFSYHENINISNNQWIRWAIWILSLISYEKFSQNQELRSLQEMSSNETFQITYRNKQDVLFQMSFVKTDYSIYVERFKPFFFF